jgi:hypothetical protein
MAKEGKAMTQDERVESIISRLDRHQCNELLRTISLGVYEDEDEEQARLVVQINYDGGNLEAEAIEKLG